VINPLRSEAEAYRFLLLTVGYFAAIVVATLALGRWVGFAVFVLLTVAGLVYLVRARRTEPPRRVATREGSENVRRILVVANETVGGATLRERIRERSEGARAEVLVVAPALNSPIRHWASDEDGARAVAEARLRESLSLLRAGGVSARGEVGDAEPLQAIEDALRTFGADEIIISTHPEGRSQWLERGVVSAARERFAVPITHVVVDLDADREDIR
jgi:membrane protein implicated in regulation of membrane protease activity